MKKARHSLFLIGFLFLLVFLFNTPVSGAEESEDERTTNLLSDLKSVAVRDGAEAEVQIARNFLELRKGALSEQEFYRKLSQMTMPADKEPRHMLSKVKKDIFDVGGKEGLEHFLGAQYPDGGSHVERLLLEWRRKLVFAAIRDVMTRFKGRNVRDANRFSVFLAEIGSWTREAPEAMRFAGDIDFSFVSGDLELAKEMKEAFAGIILAETGMTPEQVDAVCTAHGMATDEVYVGPQGQAFGEEAMRKSTLIVLDFESGAITDKRVPGNEALQRVVLEAKLAKIPLVDILTVKWPTEPGISLEMIRHFEHDIMKKNIYGDVDSFLKAAKYLNRSTVARHGTGAAPPDPLSGFASELMTMKESGATPDVVAEFILRSFQEATGKPFPKVHLGPANQQGLSKVEIEDRDQAIRHFWEQCKSKMWENAMHGFREKVTNLKRTMDGATKETAATAYEEVSKLREMMEVEFRVLSDTEVGLDALPPEFLRVLEDFREEYKKFVRKYPEVGGDQILASYKFIDELLKARKPSSVKLAMAALLESPHFVNNFLDVIDDTLLGELRGASPGWEEYLQRQKELRWGAEVEKVAGINRNAAAQSQQNAALGRRIMDTLNKDLSGIYSNALAARIQNANRILGQSIQSSAPARGAMTAMIAFNLTDEIPAYVRLFYKGAAEGDWGALATEIFRRRIPFGSTTEHYVMGNYFLATWDFCATLVPPVSLAQVAVTIAQAATEWSFRFWYHTELELFIDTLYAGATFQLNDVNQIDGKFVLGKWKLLKVNYRNHEVNVDEYIQQKEKQIEEMVAALRVPYAQREFPSDYDASDPITGWTAANETLRENLKFTDEALLVIDEIRKHPDAGEKLQSNYYDFYLTRWAQVKLSFLIRTIRRLEDRRAAEQALVSGQLPYVLEELQRAANELAIGKEVAANLERETGSAFWQFVTWLRDWIVGQKRAYYAQPDIEDVLEKGARVLIRYQQTYTAVLKARYSAEQVFSLGAPVDQGLRMLTGGHFLEGSADSDETTYPGWAATPDNKRLAVDGELSAIKRKYRPGTTLDLTPGSFDRNTLDMVAFHDVWRELWKHVNSRGIRGEPGFWEIMRDYWTPVAAPGSAGPDPMERHGFHKAQRDDLVARFEEHYKEIVQTAEAEETEEGRDQRCATLRGDVSEVNALLAAMNTRIDELREKITKLQNTISGISSREREAAKEARQAEQSAQKVVEAKQQMEQSALAVCQNMEGWSNSDSAADKARLSGEIAKLLQQAELLHKSSGAEYQKAIKSAETAENAFHSVKTLPDEIRTELEQLEILAEELRQLRSRIEIAKSAVTAIPAHGAEPSTPQFCDAETAEALRAAEDGLLILDSKLKTITGTSGTWGPEADREASAERIGELARDARASSDVAEVFLDGVEAFLGDARSCGSLSSDAAQTKIREVYFVVRIEGSGFTPTWAGDSYAISGFGEKVFTLRQGEDLAAILQAHRDWLLGDVCNMHTPSAFIYKDAAPAIWLTGPRLTVTTGPITDSTEAYTWKTNSQWKLTDEHAPGLQAIREAAGCE